MFARGEDASETLHRMAIPHRVRFSGSLIDVLGAALGVPPSDVRRMIEDQEDPGTCHHLDAVVRQHEDLRLIAIHEGRGTLTCHARRRRSSLYKRTLVLSVRDADCALVGVSRLSLMLLTVLTARKRAFGVYRCLAFLYIGLFCGGFAYAWSHAH